mmetsp:Transcript_57049/g.98277  ORF Transcript_57049/g.98277 Transcript_57049/m.98277 type:complete len:228 (-) Transcript_57049:138-821(-)
MKFMLQSEYLGCMAVLVVAYGVCIQFSDIMFKSMVKELHPDAIAYQRYFASFSSRVGVTTFFVIFLGSNVIKRFGWRGGAYATPIVMLLLGTPFFGLLLVSGDSAESLALVVAVGSFHAMMSKAMKNAVFDPTTQMAYIPLEEESKVKGKAAVDVMGSRLGKSGCALLQQLLVFVFGTIYNAAPAVTVIFYLVCACWLAACGRLDVLFAEKKKEAVLRNKLLSEKAN